ncbi:MAG: TonB-dependent receptor [Ignavibacteriae bacterium]|nr:TonB-dependent receptor [Ignavibacteriota bacterium]
MKNVFVSLAMILLLCTAGAAYPRRNQSRPAGASRIVLSGTVIDSSTGEPLVGASIFLKERGTGQFSRVDGGFAFDDVPPGRYTLQVRYIGYLEKTQVVFVRESMRLTLALAPAPVLLAEVDVTASISRFRESSGTQAREIMTPAELDRHRGQTLGETLEDIPGVTVLQTGPSISKPVIRGLHSQRIKIVNDGIAQEGQQWGGEHAPEIDPFDADRIEVVKGAAGVEYGAGAIGGVVRLDPRPFPNADGIGGKLALNAFSNNMQGAVSLMVEGRHEAVPGLAWRAQGGARKAGSAHAPGYVIGNSGFEESTASGAVRYDRGPLGFEAAYRLFETTLGIYRGSHIGNYDDLLRAITAGHPLTDYNFTYDIAAPKQHIRHDVASLTGSYHKSGFGVIDFQAGFQTNHRQEFDVHRRWFDTSAADPRPAFDLTLETQTVDLRFRREPGSIFSGSMGINGLRQTNIGNSLSFLIPNFRSYGAGVHVLESATVDDWFFEAGARVDYLTTQVFAYAPKNVPDTTHKYAGYSAALGARWAFAPDWSIAVNAAAAWRPPSVNELYSNGVHHGTAQFEIGDGRLAGERSTSIDFTLRHGGESTMFELNASQSLFADFISLVHEAEPTLTLRGLFPTFRYMQYNRIFLQAVDASLEQRVAEYYRIGLSVSHIYAAVLPGSAPLHQMPAPRARLTNHFHLPALGPLHEPYLEATVLAVARQYRAADQLLLASPGQTPLVLTPPPGYVIVELGAGADVEFAGTRLSASLHVRNLFNTPYRDYLSRFRYYVDEPGRDIVLRLQIPFGLSAGETGE